jgi:3-hydroxyisobutyrate dehydrogenase
MSSTANSERIGFIGLGNIGAPMAMRIVDAGHPLRVYNRGPNRADPFAARGVPVAPSAAALARECDIVFMCVSNTAAVEAVVFGPDGVAAGGRTGMLVVDLSTIHPQATRDMAARLARTHGMGWVDSPVSGGPGGAAAGTLAAMVGGSTQDVERVRPVLRAFAGKVTHMGPAGNGMATKACNQMLSFGACAVACETLNLAARFGLDPNQLLEAVTGGFADSNMLRHYGKQITSGNFSGNTVTAMKDLEIGLDMARLTASPLPMISMVASFFRMALDKGHTATGMAAPMHLYADGPLVPAPQPSQTT